MRVPEALRFGGRELQADAGVRPSAERQEEALVLLVLGARLGEAIGIEALRIRPPRAVLQGGRDEGAHGGAGRNRPLAELDVAERAAWNVPGDRKEPQRLLPHPVGRLEALRVGVRQAALADAERLLAKALLPLGMLRQQVAMLVVAAAVVSNAPTITPMKSRTRPSSSSQPAPRDSAQRRLKRSAPPRARRSATRCRSVSRSRVNPRLERRIAKLNRRSLKTARGARQMSVSASSSISPSRSSSIPTKIRAEVVARRRRISGLNTTRPCAIQASMARSKPGSAMSR